MQQLVEKFLNTSNVVTSDRLLCTNNLYVRQTCCPKMVLLLPPSKARSFSLQARESAKNNLPITIREAPGLSVLVGELHRPFLPGGPIMRNSRTTILPGCDFQTEVFGESRPACSPDNAILALSPDTCFLPLMVVGFALDGCRWRPAFVLENHFRWSIHQHVGVVLGQGPQKKAAELELRQPLPKGSEQLGIGRRRGGPPAQLYLVRIYRAVQLCGKATEIFVYDVCSRCSSTLRLCPPVCASEHFGFV